MHPNMTRAQSATSQPELLFTPPTVFLTDVQRGIEDIPPTGIPPCQLPLNALVTLLLTALTGPFTSAEFRLSHRVRTYDMERPRAFDKHRIPDRRRTQVYTWSVRMTFISDPAFINQWIHGTSILSWRPSLPHQSTL